MLKFNGEHLTFFGNDKTKKLLFNHAISFNTDDHRKTF